MRLIFVVILLFASEFNAHAIIGSLTSNEPHQGFQVKTSEHFRVEYPREYDVEANAILKYSEEAHQKFSKFFSYKPSHKITIVAIDNQDQANGLTTAVGLQGVVVYLTPPDPSHSIAEYDNWLRMLVIHELAHYFSLEQTHDLFKVLRYVFGNVVFPNHLWPAWLAEGMAVYLESIMTGAGRGHSAYYDTLTRHALIEKKFESGFLSYSKIMSSVPGFPFGEAPYYVGFGIMEELSKKHGKDAIARYANMSASRIPFFLDGALENISRDSETKSFSRLWESWIESERARMQPDIAHLKNWKSEKSVQIINEEPESKYSVRVSPNGKYLAYLLRSGHERSSLYVLELANKSAAKILDVVSPSQISWSADSESLLVAKDDFRGAYNIYSDIYRVNRDGSNETRITKFARAKDPEFCGENIVYTTQVGRISRLMYLERSKEPRILYQAPDYHHISSPRCDSKNETVYFSEHTMSPFEEVHSIQLKSGARAKLFGGERYGALFPQPVGANQLYFTKRENNYFVLSKFDRQLNTTIDVLTLPGGVLNPSFSTNDTVYFSYLTSGGIQIAQGNLTKADHPVLSGVKKPQSLLDQRAEWSKVSSEKPSYAQSSYNLLRSLAPRVWSPVVLWEVDRKQIGAGIGGWDDVDNLQYVFAAWYDTIPKGPAGFLNLRNRFLTFESNLQLSSTLTGYIKSGDVTVYTMERKASVSLARPIPKRFFRITPALVAEIARTKNQSTTGWEINELPDWRVGGDLSFSSLQRFNYSITSEDGVYVGARYRHIGWSNYRANKFELNVHPIFSIWPQHANLSLNLTGSVVGSPSGLMPGSDLRIGGAGTSGDLNPGLRGYPLGNFSARRAVVSQTELRFPLLTIFNGMGNFPLFFRNVGVYGYYDFAKLYQTTAIDAASGVGSAGGGFLFNTTFAYNYPIQIKVEAGSGFRTDLGGQKEIGIYFSGF